MSKIVIANKIHYCLRIILLLFVCLRSNAQGDATSVPDIFLYPFEDYSNCRTGFLNGAVWPRDTIYPARFDEVYEIGDVFRVNSNEVYINHWIVSENGKFGCLSERNKWELDCIYDNISYDRFSRQFIVEQNGKFGTLNLAKQTVFPFEFDAIYTEFPVVAPDYFPNLQGWNGEVSHSIFARKNGLLGVYDKEGKAIIAPAFDEIESYFFESGYDIERGDTLNKQFYRVQLNGNFGLYNGAGKMLVPVRYKQLNLLFDQQLTRNTLLFSVTDSLNRHSIIDEYGKQQVPFSKFEYRVAITKGTKQQLEMPAFVTETDPKTGKQRISSLKSGKTSNWYSEVKLIGDFVWAESNNRWVVLDADFKQAFSQVNAKDQLCFFNAEQSLMPAESVKNTEDFRDLKSYNESEYTIPPVFVVERETGNKKQPKKMYGLADVSSGKQSSVSYEQVLRLALDTTYYYWCFFGVENPEAEKSRVSVDIYDASLRLVNSIQTNWRTDELATPDRSYYNFNSGYAFPLVWSDTPAGKYTVHGVDGWQPAFHEYEDRVAGIYKSSDSTGNIHFTDSDYHHYFTDFEGKPLLGGKHFAARRYTFGLKWIMDLNDGTNTQFVNEKLEILLDSCEEVMYHVSYPKIRDHISSGYENYVFAIRKGYVYFLDGNSIKPVDEKMFDHPAGMNEITYNLYVDNSGKKISDQQVEIYLKSQKRSYGSIWLWIENGSLYVENLNHKPIRVIPNVSDYKPDYNYNNGSIVVIRNDNKQGFLNSNDGSWIMEPKYEEIAIRGKYWPRLIFAKDSGFSDSYWFVISEKGEPMTKPIFDKPFEFESSLDWTYGFSKGKVGLINRKMEWVTTPEYTAASGIDGVTILKGTDHNAVANPATGKSFPTQHDSIVQINGNNYLFLFHDSLQIVDQEGTELLPAMKISDAIETKNLGKFFYDGEDYYEMPYAAGNHLFVSDTNTFFVRLNNKLILENARYNAISFHIMESSGGYSAQTNPGRCAREVIFLNNRVYCEQVRGDCFKHAESMQNMSWNTTYRSYWIRDNTLVPIENVCELFVEGSDYESVLDKLMERAIQERQTFGMACANIPAAIAGFKRNFYFRDNYLYFIDYDLSYNNYIAVDPNELQGLLKGVVK